MEIAPLIAQDRQIVQAYGNGGFLVSDHPWRGAIIVFPKRTIAWGVRSVEDFEPATFSAVSDSRDPPIELLLIGAGKRNEFLKASLRAQLRGLGLAIETMDTGAACRTYNLLVSEERRVAAALLPVA